MKRKLRELILQILTLLCARPLHARWGALMADLKVRHYRRHGITLNFVSQGGFDFDIMGDLSRFSIDETSHIKSHTYIETSGSVRIGAYFHPGRGLTIFSTNHNYDQGSQIPYDAVVLERPVAIGDFVWCGANVTIVPGVTIGEGAVLGAGSVITKDVPPLAVVGGNPATIIKFRNAAHFQELKSRAQFH